MTKPSKAADAKIIITYNVNSSKLSKAFGVLRSIVAPATLPGNLYKLTYNFTKIKPGWQSFLDSLEYGHYFLFRDEFQELYPHRKFMKLPTIFMVKDDVLRELVPASTLDNIKNLDELKQTMLTALANFDNLPPVSEQPAKKHGAKATHHKTKRKKSK